MQLVNETIRLSATDLANFLGCRHLTWLDHQLAHERITKPSYHDPTLESLAERGQMHEDAYVAYLKAQGRRVEKLEPGDAVRNRERALELMRDGVDVIVQPVMMHGRWLGYADLLVRVVGESDFGNYAYEAKDTKLSRSTKAGAVLQLALYSDILERMQGSRPEHMHVVAPGVGAEPFAIDSLRFGDYRAYYLSVRQRLERAVDAMAAPTDVPEPVAKCDTCRWVFECETERRRVDHVSFVARSTRGQRDELKEHGVDSLTKLAQMPLPISWKPKRGSQESLAKVRDQALIQHKSKGAKVPLHEIITCNPDEGLGRLPAPDDGDIFFDFEGNPFVRDGGLEYLFGYTSKDGFTGDWAFTRGREKLVFEKLVDDLMKRWKAWPKMHVYHFAPYEPAAMRRLMMRHGTRAREVDQMLRAGLFVDLYAVVREGVRVGVESYSIKRLEACFGFERDLALADVGPRKRALELSSDPEQHLEKEWLEVVWTYNRHDCESAMKLRDWLESLRARDARRPAPPVEKAENESDEAREGRELRERLEAKAATLEDGSEREAMLLLASLVEFHQREAKVIWWELFRLRDLSLDALHEEPHALTGLDQLPREPDDDKAVERYRYPYQEIDVRDGDTIYRFEDADGELENDGKVKSAGKVEEVDRGQRIITVRRIKKRQELRLTNVYFHNYVHAGPIRDALAAFADNTQAPHCAAASGLLHRRGPRSRDGTMERLAGEEPMKHAIRVVKALDGGVLPIQGPPGAGKTFTASHMIVALVEAGKKVGVTATSHKVITHLMNGVAKAAHDDRVAVRCIQKVKDKPANRSGVDEVDDDAIYDALEQGTHDVFGGTAWCWTSTKLPTQLDYLFVDEAGQFSLANALAVATAAKNLVLVGDPRQLEQPQRGAHPEGAGISALQHLLGEHRTIPNDRGIFLAETWRLDPAICEFTSAAFYSDRLRSAERSAARAIHAGPLKRCGLYRMAVPHTGCGNASPAEAEAISRLIECLTMTGSSWTDADGKTVPLTREHIKIVAPYNVQVALLREAVGSDVEIGTVDEFQGQEAAVVVVSMTSSTVAEAPRGFEFLLSPNRLNVGTSRGKCACILVSSPSLFDLECRTPEQMLYANAMCEYEAQVMRSGLEITL